MYLKHPIHLYLSHQVLTQTMENNANTSVKHQKRGPQSFKQAEEVGLIGSRIWTQPELTILLHEYKKREFLYDMKNVNYRNKFAREQALKEIADILCKVRPQTTAMDVKLKFNILRTQYHAELSKEKKCAESGKFHLSTLWFMDHIKFVRGHNRREIYGRRENESSSDNKSFEQLPQVNYEDQASLSEDCFVENDEKYDEFEDKEASNAEDPLSTLKKRPTPSDVKTEMVFLDTESEMTSDFLDDKEDEDDGSSLPVISSATSTLHQKRSGTTGEEGENPRKAESSNEAAKESSVRTSEEDLFGQIVAKKLKKITNPRKRADAELKIFSILHSAFIDELDT
ncbi:uncharacterized protein LOC124176904 isoform X1 [Neodiprion fabricii]|uniref:uncharacterized protein LOC124176904 isoform X1 n=2 Tax=Neodiprion fabricii TaxID=2872261 RepID=UPI001ED8F60A|nr:uncharacterized protein LOC124176904 isoform X1 [Neodiprion fabricii]